MFDSFLNNNTGESFKIDALPSYLITSLSEVWKQALEDFELPLSFSSSKKLRNLDLRRRKAFGPMWLALRSFL